MQSSGKGKLYIVGTGPGNTSYLTKRALEAVDESEYIIGNDFYLNLIKDNLEGKEVIWSSMGKEVERKLDKLLNEYVRKTTHLKVEMKILLIDFAGEYNKIWSDSLND